MTKEEVQTMIDEAVSAAQPQVYTDLAEVPAWAQGTVQRAMEAGIIRGDEHGRIHLTADNLVNLQMLANAKAF